MVEAPAFIAASQISFKKPISLLHASSQLNSTSSHRLFAYCTASTARFMTSCGCILSLNSIWIGLVAMKVWMRPSFAPFIASPAALISFSKARASEQTRALLTAPAIFSIASKSPGLAAAKPASITSTPSFSSCNARWIFSSVFIDAPGLCSPSRSVVSKIMILFLSIACPFKSLKFGEIIAVQA